MDQDCRRQRLHRSGLFEQRKLWLRVCPSPFGLFLPIFEPPNIPNNSLYVDDEGKVGMGTNSPITQLHVQDGNSPAMRLHQDGSNGFTQQIWDIAGNETNFFVT